MGGCGALQPSFSRAHSSNTFPHRSWAACNFKIHCRKEDRRHGDVNLRIEQSISQSIASKQATDDKRKALSQPGSHFSWLPVSLVANRHDASQTRGVLRRWLSRSFPGLCIPPAGGNSMDKLLLSFVLHNLVFLSICCVNTRSQPS